MRFWRTSYDSKLRQHIHRVAPGRGHALLVHVASRAFASLRVPAALTDGRYWWELFVTPSLQTHEIEHGVVLERGAYNARQWAELKRTRRTVRGRYGGYMDLFVPVVIDGEVVAAIVTGPFADARPDANAIAERWRAMSGREPHPSDPEFASYLGHALSALVLERAQLARYQRLLEHMAELTSGQGRAGAHATEIEALYVALLDVRFAERSWEAVQTMVDDRFQRLWSSASYGDQLTGLGLPRAPDHLLVGLATRRDPELDTVEQAVRRDAFARTAVDLARRSGSMVAGRVGDQGIVFLSAAGGSSRSREMRLRDLVAEVSRLGRTRFDFESSFGASAASETVPLSRSYQAALAAAESALAEGKRFVIAPSKAAPKTGSLRRLRDALARDVEGKPEVLSARFERYLEAVAVSSGYRIEPARIHLEVGFERLSEVLVESGAIEPRNLQSLNEGLERESSAAITTQDLLDVYRRAARDLYDATERPAAARRDHSLRRALDYVHHHYTQPLRVERVARIAGFAPDHFARLFKARERTTVAQYVLGLRLDHAQRLLSDSEFDVTRIARLSGFGSVQYFCQAFRRERGCTPLEYRRDPAPKRGRRRAGKHNDKRGKS